MKTQTNVYAGGPRPINAGEDLTGLEGRLVKLADGGSKVEVVTPTTVKDITPFVLVREAGLDESCDVLSLAGEKEVRIRANGTGSAGDVLVLCDPTASTGANKGKVETVGATAGSYFSPGIAMEDFVDEQLVRVRPLPRLVVVPATFTGATPASTASTNSSPYGFGQTQADALVTTVREIRAALLAQGIMLPNS